MPNDSKEIIFKLATVNILESSFSLVPQMQYPLVAYNHNINVENRFNLEKGLAISIISVILADGENEVELGKLKVNYVFEVKNLEKYLQPNEVAEEIFLNTLNSIAISTTRGIMFMSFRGTHLHNAILPVIDATSLVAQVE